jgi:hypothetical protein
VGQKGIFTRLPGQFCAISQCKCVSGENGVGTVT